MMSQRTHRHRFECSVHFKALLSVSVECDSLSKWNPMDWIRIKQTKTNQQKSNDAIKMNKQYIYLCFCFAVKCWTLFAVRVMFILLTCVLECVYVCGSVLEKQAWVKPQTCLVRCHVERFESNWVPSLAKNCCGKILVYVHALVYVCVNV